MSKYVDRTEVFQTTKVRTSLKGDGSWIQKAKKEEEEKETPRTDSAVETRPSPVRQNSYVLFTAKKFESVASPVSPSFSPAEHDSVIPTNTIAQPEKSIVETTDDTKPQTPTKDVIQSGWVETYTTDGNSEGASFVKPIEQPVANTAAEDKDEYVDTSVDQSEAEPSVGATEVSADAHVEDPVGESSVEAVTEHSQDTTELAVEVKVQSTEKPEVRSSVETEPANTSNVDVGVEPTIRPVDGSCEVFPSKEATVEPATDPAVEQTVQPAVEVTVESSVETTAVTNAAPGVESAVQDTTVVEPVPELLAESVSEAPPGPAAEAAVQSVESKTESAAEAEPVVETQAEGVVKCEVPTAAEAVVEQSGKPTPDTATDHKMESNVEVAVEPVLESAAEAVPDQLAERPIELTEALDVEPPRAQCAPEPVEHKESHSEEVRLNQDSASTNTGSATEIIQKPVVDLQTKHTLSETSDAKAVCSFCDKTIEGNVKITLNIPPVFSHPECLKCGVCGRALGDMMTAMFLHGQVIHCNGCFAKTL